MTLPSGTESARPFIPAKDFAVSKAFYEALGFQKRLDSDVAIFAIGPTAFILQRFYEKEFAENFMMQLMVDDLDAWWAHIDSLDLPKTFAVPCSPGACAWPTSWTPPACSGTSRSAASTRRLTRREGSGRFFEKKAPQKTSDSPGL